MIAIALAGDVMHQQETSHPIYRSYCGNLSRDFNRMVSWAIRDKVEWLVLGTDQIFTGELTVVPKTPISMLRMACQNADGAWPEAQASSIFVIHRSIFNRPPFDERFECHWMDFASVFLQWWHLDYSENLPTCGLTVRHPYHAPRPKSMSSFDYSKQLFYKLFKDKHGVDFDKIQHVNPWYTPASDRKIERILDTPK